MRLLEEEILAFGETFCVEQLDADSARMLLSGGDAMSIYLCLYPIVSIIRNILQLLACFLRLRRLSFSLCCCQLQALVQGRGLMEQRSNRCVQL